MILYYSVGVGPEPVGHSHVMELLVLVNQPEKWTLRGVINVGVFTT